MGGNSIGVTRVDLSGGPAAFVECARATLMHFGSPVLVEQFQPGREIMVIIIGGLAHIEVTEAVELHKLGDEGFFNDRIFDLSLKQ